MRRVPTFQGRELTQAPRPATVGSGRPEAFSAAAGFFRAAADTLRPAVKQRQETLGVEEALADVENETFNPKTPLGPRSQAYNAAGQRHEQIKLLGGLENDLAKLFEDHGHEAAKLEKALSDYRDGALTKLKEGDRPAETRSNFVAAFDRLAASYMGQAARAADARQQDASRAAMAALLDGGARQILTLAQNGGTLAELSAATADLQEQLVGFGPKGEFELNGVSYPADPNRAGAMTVSQIQGRLLDVGQKARGIAEGVMFQDLADAEERRILGGVEAATTADLVPHVIHMESRGNGAAVGPPIKKLGGERARGLMGLLPDTAREVHARLYPGVPFDEERLTSDWEYNRTLGTAYLDQMMQRYSGNAVLALAAYNAGMGWVDKWLDRFGDPRQGEISTTQFAAKIPFKETRNYVAEISSRMGQKADFSLDVALNEINQIGDRRLRAELQRRAVSAARVQGARDRAEAAARDSAMKETAARLDIAIAGGQVTDPQLIEEAFNAGQIGVADFRSLSVKLAREQSKALEAQREMERGDAAIAAAIEAGIPPDLSDRATRDALERNYSGAIEAAVEGGGDPVQTAVFFARKTRTIPQTMERDITAGLRSADPEAQATSVQMVSTLLATDPQLAADLKGADMEFAKTAAVMHSNGVPVAEAVEMARKAIFEPNDGERQLRRAQFDDDEIGDDIWSDLISAAEGRDGRFFNADVPEGIREAFVDIAREKYAQTGSQDTALALAEGAFFRRFGVTEVGGGGARWMRDAPEHRYRLFEDPAENREWIDRQMRATAIPAMREAGFDIDDDATVILRSAAQGFEEFPAYDLLIEDEDGLLQTLSISTGMLFQPDMRAAAKEAGKRLDKERAAAIAEVEQERDGMSDYVTGVIDRAERQIEQARKDGADQETIDGLQRQLDQFKQRAGVSE